MNQIDLGPADNGRQIPLTLADTILVRLPESRSRRRRLGRGRRRAGATDRGLGRGAEWTGRRGRAVRHLTLAAESAGRWCYGPSGTAVGRLDRGVPGRAHCELNAHDTPYGAPVSGGRGVQSGNGHPARARCRRDAGTRGVR